MKYLIIMLSFVVVSEMYSQFKIGKNTKQIGNNNFFELESLIGSKVVITKDSGMIGIGTTTPLVDLDIVSKKVATNTINADFGLLRLARPTSSGGKWGHVAQFNLGSYSIGGAAATRLDIGLNNDGNLIPSPILTLQGNGNIGFGITGPSQRLDVNGSGLFRRGNSANGFSFNQILFGHNGSNLFQHAIKTRHAGGTAQGNAIDFYIWTNAVNQDIVASQHIMSLEGQGRVGIGGITNPISVIDAASIQAATATVNADRKMLRFSIPTTVNVKVGNVAEFNMGSYAIEGTSAKTRLDLALNDGIDANVSSVMTWQGNGKVGIGTTDPDRTLSIVQAGNGNAFISNSSPNLMRFESTTASSSIGHYFKAKNAVDIVKETVMGINPNLNSNNGVFFFGLGNGEDLLGFDLVNFNSYASTITGSKFGIGTKTPATKLHIMDPINNVAFQSILTIEANPATLASNGFNGVNPNIAKMSSGIQFLGWNGIKEGGIFRQTGSGSKSHMLFTVNNTNDVAMVITENRNVGIGTNTPTNKLHVNGNALFTPRSSNDGQGGEPVSVEIYGKSPNGTATQVGGIKMGWYNATGGIEILRGGGSFGVGLAFNVSPDFSGGTTFEAMRIMLNGNVGIGTTAPTAKLHINGSALATAWNTTSDVRLKTNIIPIENASNVILKLRAVKYIKKQQIKDSFDSKNQEIGFIAQDVQKILPEVVNTGNDEDQTLSINYSSLIPLLVKSIQEQNEELKKQQSIIEKQHLEIEKLKLILYKINKN